MYQVLHPKKNCCHQYVLWTVSGFPLIPESYSFLSHPASSTAVTPDTVHAPVIPAPETDGSLGLANQIVQPAFRPAELLSPKARTEHT